MSQSSDVIVSKHADAVAGHGRQRVLMSASGMLQCLPGPLVSRLVILFPLLLIRHAMGMRRAIVQFGGALMIPVMGSIVVARRHNC